jgi:hypothetical protein
MNKKVTGVVGKNPKGKELVIPKGQIQKPHAKGIIK